MIRVRSATMRDLKGYHACFDAVARERRHLGSTAAPSLKGSRGWLRAVADGTVYVLASNLVLSRKAITAWIGGHEPPTMPPQPPYT